MLDFYQILGVTPDSSAEEIHSRFRFLALAYHPDRFTDSETKAKAEEEMKRINEAYSTLSNPRKRDTYDRNRTTSTGVNQKKPTEDISSEYISKIEDYFLKLFDKWEHILDTPPTSLFLKQITEEIGKLIVFLLQGIYDAPEAPGANSSLNELSSKLTLIVLANMVLGAELSTKGLPTQYNLIELQVSTCLPFYKEMYHVASLVNLKGTYQREIVEKTTNSIIELTLQTCNIGVEIGRERARKTKESQNPKNPQPNWKPNEEQRKVYENQRVRDPQPTRKSYGEPLKTAPEQYICQMCGRPTITESLSFSRNIGMLIMRQTKTTNGNMCAACAENLFWNYSGINLLLGWWGAISFLITPILFLMNIINYVKSWKLRQYSDGLWKIAWGWKLLFLSILAGFAFYYLYANGWFTMIAYDNNPTVMHVSPAYPTRTSMITNRVTPTLNLERVASKTYTPVVDDGISPLVDDCVSPSQVTDADEGRVLCVKGIIYNSYLGADNGYRYISFSSNPNPLCFVNYGGYDFKKESGDCVSATGVIVVDGQMPYIKVEPGDLVECNP